MSNYKEDGGPSALTALAPVALFKVLSFGVASQIYKKVQQTAQPRIASLGDHGFVYLSAWLLSNTPFALWVLNQSHRHVLGLPRPDQAIYKVTSRLLSLTFQVVDDWSEPSAAKGFALLDAEGDVGKFNRSNRAYQNFLEYLPSLLAYGLCAGYVFPKVTFVTTLVGFFARLGYAIGYTEKPVLRMPGFVLSILSMNLLEGLTLFSGVKALGYW